MYVYNFRTVIFSSLRSLGAKIEWLSKEQLKQRFPWLQLDGITQGTLGNTTSVKFLLYGGLI